MARRIVIYDDFSKGEYDLLTSDNAPKGSWTGRNMLVYSTGEIGVRPGVKLVTPTGVANGDIFDMGVETSGNEFSNIWYSQGNQVRYFPLTSPGVGAVANYAGTYSGTPTWLYQFHDGFSVYQASNLGIYSHLPTTLTTLNAALVNAISVVLLGDRLVAAVGNTLRYSDAANFTSWPVANTIVVGDDADISALFVQRTQLQIFKSSGIVYTLTGVPGVNEVLRRTATVKGPEAQRQGVVALDEMIWYTGQNSNHPRSFDGAVARTIPFLRTNFGSNLTTWCRCRDIDRHGAFALSLTSASVPGTLLTGPEGLLNSNGAWTYHDFTGPALLQSTINNFFVTSLTRPYGYDQNPLADMRFGEAIVMGINGGASAPPQFYAWAYNLDRPGSEYSELNGAGFPTQIPERAGDNSSEQVSGRFSMPEWWSDEGSEIVVRGVIVDFKTWDTGGSLTNHFDVSVDVLRRWNNDAPGTAQPLAWDQAGSLASTTGTRRRETFSFGDSGIGNGFQINFTNVRGVSIRRIQVLVDSSPVRVP